jgi:hypothetical protein
MLVVEVVIHIALVLVVLVALVVAVMEGIPLILD